MRFVMLLRVSLKALRRNMMRTILTMLGVIIGVAAVVCTVAIGEGASIRIREAIASIGDNVVWVEAGGVNRGGVRTGSGATKSLTLADMEAIKDQIPLITYISPIVDVRTQLIYGNQNWNAQARGVSPDYVHVKAWRIAKGGMFEPDGRRARGAGLCARADGRRSAVWR
jgi:putative ABC transport system permease protein